MLSLMLAYMLFELCTLFDCQHSSTVVNTSNAAGAAESVDDDLPSVMTCANYLKLPPYSTKVCFLLLGEFFFYLLYCTPTFAMFGTLLQEVMNKKLLYAINEGQGSFDLS